MPVNRFDQPIGQRYVSQYVPLPFQELAALGENIQKRSQTADDQMSALEKMIADVNVVNEVYSAGDLNDPGYGYRSTGYLDYKNELLNKVKTGHAELYDKYKNNEIDLKEFEKRARDFNNQFKQDFSKLKLAEANSAVIQKMDEERRKNQEAGKYGYLNNELAKEGYRLRQNPFSTEYKGAPISKFIEEEDLVNKFADNFKDKILKDTSMYRDAAGKLHYRSISGVSEQHVLNSLKGLGNSSIAKQWEDEVEYNLNHLGKNWNSEYTYKIPEYDKKGNQIGEKEVKTTIGDYLYKQKQQNFVEAVINKAVKQDLKEDIKSDNVWDYQRKKAIDEEERKAGLNWSTSQMVSDPNNPYSTTEGINKALEDANFPFKLDENLNLVDNVNTSPKIKGVKIGDKIYSESDIKAGKLPQGYSTAISYSTPEGYVVTKNGKEYASISEIDNPNAKGNLQESISKLYKMGRALGISNDEMKGAEGLANMKRIVSKYIQKAYSTELDFIQMDEGSINALSKAYSVESKIDRDGNAIITNPGKLSFVEIKDANGKLVKPEDKQLILQNAKLLGPMFSMINKNIESGDLALQGADGKRYIINTKNNNIKNALYEQDRATKSLNKYILTGKKEIDNTERGRKFKKDIENNLGKTTADHVVDYIEDGDNAYLYYVKGFNKEIDDIEMGVIKIDPNSSNPYLPIDISTANKEISQNRLVNTLPNFNTKNFDKGTNLETIDSNED